MSMLNYKRTNHPTTFIRGVKMQVNKPKRLSLVEQVTVEIELLIKQGFWNIGDKIPPEKELIKQFDVSRNTLREAIQALVHVGILETKQGSGTRVLSASALSAVLKKHVEKTSILQILEVRLALEREAAMLAAERRNIKEVIEMKRLIKVCEDASKKQDYDAFIDADVKLHKVIIEASKNSLLVELYSEIAKVLEYSIDKILSVNKLSKTEYIIHKDLVQAIEKQNVDIAGELVELYITEWKKSLENLVGA